MRRQYFQIGLNMLITISFMIFGLDFVTIFVGKLSFNESNMSPNDIMQLRGGMNKNCKDIFVST